MDVLEKLRHIYADIREVNRGSVEHRGKDLEEIRAAFESMSVSPPPALVTLYTWFDGIDYVDGLLTFLPLSRAADIYRGYQSFKKDWPDFDWQPEWFPVLDMNADVTICIDTGTNAVFAIDMEDSRCICMGRDFEKYVDVLFEAFSAKKYSYDSVSGSIEFEPEYWRTLASRHDIIGIHEIW